MGRRRVAVRIETPRGSFVKRDWVEEDGGRGGRLRVAFVSPVPCPFDYGHAVGEPAADGRGRDAVWMGPAAEPLAVVEGVVAAVVRFEDGGVPDDKWVVTPDGSLSAQDEARLRRFFRLYAATKLLRGTRARFGGIHAAPDAAGGAPPDDRTAAP